MATLNPGSGIAFGPLTHRRTDTVTLYDYLLDKWQTGDIAPASGIRTVCVRRNNITRP